MLFAQGVFFKAFVHFRGHDVGLVFQEILPDELHQAKLAVFFEKPLGEGVFYFRLGRVTPVEYQVHVLRLFEIRVLAKSEEILAEKLVLDDLVDIQVQVHVILRKRVMQIRRNGCFMRQELLSQFLRVHEK